MTRYRIRPLEIPQEDDSFKIVYVLEIRRFFVWFRFDEIPFDHYDNALSFLNCYAKERTRNGHDSIIIHDINKRLR